MKCLFVALLFLHSSVQAQQFAPADTPGNGPIIYFKSTSYDAGTIPEGPVATVFYQFRNAGKKPLIIYNVQSPCGCLTPQYSKDPVLPGKSGKIKLTYSTTGRLGPFRKSVRVYCNDDMTSKESSFFNGATELIIKGTVQPAAAPLMYFPEGTTIDFGVVVAGPAKEISCPFINKGGSPLIIRDVMTSSGNLVPVSWPKEPIQPGGTGTIRFSYHTAGGSGATEKTAHIKYNNADREDANAVLTIKGTVKQAPPTVIKESARQKNRKTIQQ
ncbi:DUF1573 domain-containing protein [Chitinophagaceae bacterium MMS25-I14]